MVGAKYWPLIFGAFLIGCADSTVQLPEPISNNAVAYHAPTQTAYSFAGLRAGKTWRDVTAAAYACDMGRKACKTIASLPDGVGRLASTAQTVGDIIYVFVAIL